MSPLPRPEGFGREQIRSVDKLRSPAGIRPNLRGRYDGVAWRERRLRRLEDSRWKGIFLRRYLRERLWLVRPMQRGVVEAVFDGRFDDGEIGRDVEVARHVER